MILSKVSLLPLLGFIALTGAEVSPEVRTNIDNFKTNLDSTIAALHAYQGGVTGLATLMHSAYLTRQAIEQSKSHMQQTDQYSLDDSAEISNNTVAHFQSVVEFLNLIHTKVRCYACKALRSILIMWDVSASTVEERQARELDASHVSHLYGRGQGVP